MIHRTTSCRGLKTEVPKGVAQQYVAQHPPIMSDLEHSARASCRPEDERRTTGRRAIWTGGSITVRDRLAGNRSRGSAVDCWLHAGLAATAVCGALGYRGPCQGEMFSPFGPRGRAVRPGRDRDPRAVLARPARYARIMSTASAHVGQVWLKGRRSGPAAPAGWRCSWRCLRPVLAAWAAGAGRPGGVVRVTLLRNAGKGSRRRGMSL